MASSQSFSRIHRLISHSPEPQSPFDSGEPLGAGSGTLVAGVERLAVGSYPFYCKVHTSMRGVLNVVGS